MSQIELGLLAALSVVGAKPSDSDVQAVKKNWNEKLSNAIAQAFAAEFRERGLSGTLPAPPGKLGASGAEKRLAGGIGAKKVDISWSTPESGVILGCSVKTIMFRDGASQNFQKNLVNRRGDLLFESTTIHRRFPYAVLCGFLFLDVGASTDGTDRRNSTLANAFPRLRLFTRRPDPAGREEQFERLYVATVDTGLVEAPFRFYEVNRPGEEVAPNSIVEGILELIVERNFDFYSLHDGRLVKTA